MNKNLQLPPPEVMDYAAGLAAFFSKAKGSSLVPVIFTRKKFVRKSKGMAPGAVLVDKEDVLLVPPQKPDELNAED
jgi:predicted ribosome quality control (RQC) complex YloA/Tae2 family protein